MKKIEHVGIAVENIDESEKLFEALFDVEPYKREIVEAQKVLTSFIRVGNNKIELLQATSEDSVIQKFLEKKGPGFHHIAFAVTDIRSEMKRLKEQGFRLLNESPVDGADNKIVCFLHPKSTNGVLIELVQDKES
ncbi:MAG: methylmalonyl-CoA epimerase [Saprospiraceae bacterium]|nr:methylmalonyl-CoA epimerase [Bacteroidia bacterium]NNK89460.1 methylmalonyl-CoA epimerase [Saprospiraceae bacterium]